VLLSPYLQATNDHEVAFLAQAGIEVVRERAMSLSSADGYDAAPPAYWLQLALAEADPRADACFLSCTNIQSMEIVEALERELGRPVVTSNQATLWYCLRTLGLPDAVPGLGQLLSHQLPATGRQLSASSPR
jgi:maleate cis-trans isomerase